MSDRRWGEPRDEDPFDDLDALDGLDDDEDLVDFARVHADDAFLDALGASIRSGGSGGAGHGDLGGFGEPGARDDDAELAALLTSWRDEVDAEPITDLVDPRTATDTLSAARARRQRRPRLLVPVAAAAAVLAIGFTGAGLAARDAQPGDTLWGLTKVLYAEHARSVEAAASVRDDLIVAQQALEAGDLTAARAKLDEAQAGLPSVSNEDGLAALMAQHDDLRAKVTDNPSGGVQLPPSANPTTVSQPNSPLPSTTSPQVLPTTQSPVVTTDPEQPTSNLPSSSEAPTTTTTTTSDPPKVEPGIGETSGSSGTAGQKSVETGDATQ